MLCPRCAREIPEDSVLCCYCGRTIIRKQQSRIHQRPNGTGTAFQRKGQKTWTAQYTLPDGWYIDENGKRHRKRKTKGGFKIKADALNYIETLKKEAERKPAPALSHYWKLYSEGDMLKLGPDKITAYKGAWKKMTDISHRKVDTLTIKDLQDCVDKHTKTYYPAKDMRTLLKALFKRAASEKYVDKDLPTFISIPELEEGEQTPFTKEEQKALWASYESGNRDAGIPLIMIYTGMMTGEMRRLSKSMIHLKDKLILGVGLKTQERKKKSVLLPDDIIPVLEDVMAKTETDLLYNVSETQFYDLYYASLKEAGITRHLTPYSCRHTTATVLAIHENVAPQTLQRVMRWKSTKMMDRYVTPSDQDARNAVNRI